MEKCKSASYETLKGSPQQDFADLQVKFDGLLVLLNCLREDYWGQCASKQLVHGEEISSLKRLASELIVERFGDNNPENSVSRTLTEDKPITNSGKINGGDSTDYSASESSKEFKVSILNSRHSENCTVGALGGNSEDILNERRALSNPDEQKELPSICYFTDQSLPDGPVAAPDPTNNCEHCLESRKEIDTLRGSISHMMEWARQILNKLNVVEATCFDNNPHVANIHAADTDVLTAERDQLESQLKAVTEMNVQWQNYSTNLEEAKEELECRVKELQSKCSALNQKQVPMLQYIKSQQEIIRGLKQQLSQQQQSESGRPCSESLPRPLEEVAILKEALKKLEQKNREQEEGMKKQAELIQLYDQQLKTYYEDFEQERADRARARARVNELEQEVQRLQSLTTMSNLRETVRQISAHDVAQGSEGSANTHLVGRATESLYPSPAQRLPAPNALRINGDADDETDHDAEMNISLRSIDDTNNHNLTSL